MNTLEKLNAVILERKDTDSQKSYVAQLFAGGVAKISKKIGEEATETVIAALSEDNTRVISESADLLFHLSVLWAVKGISPEQVMGELEQRMGISGLDEKAARQSIEKSK